MKGQNVWVEKFIIENEEVPHLLCELMITWNNSSKEFLFEEHTLIAYKIYEEHIMEYWKSLHI